MGNGTTKKTTALAELVDDLTFGTPSDGQVLTFSSGTNKVVFATPSAGASPAGSDGQLQVKSGSGFAALPGSSSDDQGRVVFGATSVSGPAFTAKAQSSGSFPVGRFTDGATNFGFYVSASEPKVQIGSETTAGMSLFTSNLNRVVVTADGRTLIGVTPPADDGVSALQVAGDVIVTTAANNHVTLGTSTPVNNDYYMVVSCAAGVGQIYAVRQGVGAVPIAIDSGGAGVTCGGAGTFDGPLKTNGLEVFNGAPESGGSIFRASGTYGVRVNANAFAFSDFDQAYWRLDNAGIHFPQSMPLTWSGDGNAYTSPVLDLHKDSGHNLAVGDGSTGYRGIVAGTGTFNGTLKPGTIDTSTVPGTVAGQICYSSALNKTCEWDGADWQPLR